MAQPKARAALALLMSVALSELISYVSLTILQHFPPSRFLVYQPPVFSEREYQEYLSRRDPRLGWPSPGDFGRRRYDASGSRPIPNFPRPGNECATLYGDSFTFAADVTEAEAWSNVLSGHLHCRVGNYGVSGYGTDQAYLRFFLNKEDDAAVSILGLWPRDIMRNLTQYDYLENPGSIYGFKPRFILNHRALQLIPLPTIEPRKLRRFRSYPERFLLHETFLPDTRFGPSKVRVPFTRAFLRILFDERLLNVLKRAPSWGNFYQPGHLSQGLEVTTAIIERFDDLCRARHKRCLVVIFPTASSFEYRHRTDKEALAPLFSSLTKSGIDFLDLSPPLSQYLAGRPFCELLSNATSCKGHLNAEGNRLVASIIFQKLTGVPCSTNPATGFLLMRPMVAHHLPRPT